VKIGSHLLGEFTLPNLDETLCLEGIGKTFDVGESAARPDKQLYKTQFSPVSSRNVRESDFDVQKSPGFIAWRAKQRAKHIKRHINNNTTLLKAHFISPQKCK